MIARPHPHELLPPLDHPLLVLFGFLLALPLLWAVITTLLKGIHEVLRDLVGVGIEAVLTLLLVVGLAVLGVYLVWAGVEW